MEQSLLIKAKTYWNSLTKTQRIVLCFGLFFCFFFIYIFLHIPPKNFPLGEVIHIKSGESLQSITDSLHQYNVIKFPFIFRSAVIMLGGERKVIAGDYLLSENAGPFNLAKRLVNGEFQLDAKKITIPEGWNIFQIADHLYKNLENFDKEEFIKLAKKEEGHLFPETYFISTAAKPDFIIEMMKNTFKEKTRNLKISKDIVTMASILEAEARTSESRRIIAGILEKRLSINMALQVDSTFIYINGKNTYELTASDLKIDSPYNTYQYTGLPPGPIGNPGLESINDALNPTETPYLYFLSSKSGKMYYAKSFEEHKRNKELYLNK